MLALLYTLLLAPLWALANTMRDEGLYELSDKLPGPPLWYCGAFMGITIWPLSTWQAGLVVALGYIICMTPSWGPWLDINQADKKDASDGLANDAMVKMINRISDSNHHIALTLRLFIFVLPFCVVFPWAVGASMWFALFALAYPPLAVHGYHYGLHHGTTSRDGDFISGVLWWLMCMLVLF